jgi:hypothetical protein
MKTLKIVGAILVLALIIVGATVASALAYGWGAQNPYGPQVGMQNRMYQQGPQINSPVTQTNTQTPTLYTPSYTNPQQYGDGVDAGDAVDGESEQQQPEQLQLH